MKLTLPLLLTAAAASSAAAWGTLGHQSVALVAQQYLLPETIKSVQALLADTSTTYLGNIALWADSYRKELGGEFSAALHFVNGKDGPPPESCEIIYPADCPAEGCIISAIGNYTERLKNTRLSDFDRAQALKFVVHFLGDIAQPMHTEAFGGGVNNITVYFNGYRTNLHAAWDTSIPNAMLGFLPTAVITAGDSLGWANNIAAKINAGEYKPRVARWLRYHSVKNRREEERAATAWSNESNDEVCEYGLARSPDSYNGTEIGGAYYRGARPIVEMSVAKAGVRLAGWLNLVFAGTTGFEDEQKGKWRW